MFLKVVVRENKKTIQVGLILFSSLFVCVVFYIIPEQLPKEYFDMNDMFAKNLLKVVDAVLVDTDVNDAMGKVRCYLSALHSEWCTEIKVVTGRESLIAFLRKYSSLSNFDLLKRLAKNFELTESTTVLEEFTNKRDDFYKRILAVDFAKRAIKDHDTASGHKEVRLSSSHVSLLCIIIDYI